VYIVKMKRPSVNVLLATDRFYIKFTHVENVFTTATGEQTSTMDVC